MVIRTLLWRILKQHAVLLGAVLCGVFLFELLIVWFMAEMETGPGLETLIRAFLPPPMLEFISSQMGMTSFAGGVAFGFQHPFVLVAGVALIITVATIPAGERETGFLDLVLARPLTRTGYLASSALAVLTVAIAVPAAVTAGVAVGLGTTTSPADTAWTRYLPGAAAMVLLLLAVGGYTLLSGAGARRRGVAAGRAAGVTLAFYALDFLGPLWDPLEDVRWLSPFSYFDAARASVGTGLGWRDPLVLAAVALFTGFLAIAAFRRQQL